MAIYVQLLGRHLGLQVKALLFPFGSELNHQLLNLLLHPPDLLCLTLDDFLLLSHALLETHCSLLLVLEIL